MNKGKLLLYSILAFHILALILNHTFGFIGHYGYDDLHYSELALNLNNNLFDYNDHSSYRLPLTYLTALSYQIFGVSDFSSSLPPLVVSSLILYLLFLTLKKRGALVLTLGLSLCTFSTWFMFYSDKIMPDIYVAFFMILSLFFIDRHKYGDNPTSPILYAFLTALSLLLAFMAKGTVVLIIPLLLHLITIDFILKRDRTFWLSFIVSGMVLLLLYLLFMWSFTGEFFKRFSAISENGYINSCSYNQQPIAILWERISIGFFKLMTYQGLIIGYIFVVAYLFKKKSKEFIHFKDSFSFYITSSIILLLSSNFMSISPTFYNPMCLDPRHYLFLVPIVAIPASIIIKQFLNSKISTIQTILIAIIITLISFFLIGDTFFTIYLPLTLLLIGFYTFKNKEVGKWVFTTLFVIVMMINPFMAYKYALKVDYNKQKRVILDFINTGKEQYLITNDVQKRLGNYYNSFDNNSKTIFLQFNQFDSDTLDNRPTFILRNWYTEYLSGTNEENIPYYAKKSSINTNHIIQEDKDIGLTLFKTKADFIKDQPVVLFTSFNDFESIKDYWKQNNNDKEAEIIHEGKASSRINKYSSTFSYPLDSLNMDGYKSIILDGSLYCYFVSETTSKVIVSIENTEGTYYWRSIDINGYLKAYANWWKIDYKLLLNREQILPSSFLKIYIWNDSEEEGYFDDFRIEILGSK